LKKLLKVNPTDHPVSMEDILDHPFFRGGDNSKTILQQIVEEMAKEMKQSTAEVKKGNEKVLQEAQKGNEKASQKSGRCTALTV